MKDRRWRLNHLYYVKNEEGKKVLFRLNKVQNVLIENLWFLNVILKARQLGVSTFVCILFLDDVLFNGKDAGIIAHTLADAQRLFDSKVKYAWESLPNIIKEMFILDAKNARIFKFVREGISSSIYVGVSLRSGTVQRLHISELSTIDQRYPQKAEEIRTGALNTVHGGQVVIIESTAKGRQGIFWELCEEARKLKESGDELGEMDYRLHFFAWFEDPKYQLDEITPIPRTYQNYFQDLLDKYGISLTPQQKCWYYKKALTQKDSMKSEFPSTPEEAFLASIEGSYYGKAISLAREREKIVSVPHDPTIPVDTWWDLGIGDAMSIIFSQTYGMEVRIINHYENTGEGLAHYAKFLNEKDYTYRSHNAPHDIVVREIGTGKSRLEVARQLGINFNIVEKISVEDGIEAVRNLIPFCYFDRVNTDYLIHALEEYRKEWDDKLGTFKNKPLHDKWSHAADAMRTLAVGHAKIHPLGAERVDPEVLEMIREQENKIDPSDPFGMGI